ncbi:HU family DNA-binding protein [Azospirillum brasilense]|uniref:HU family DNA-binding protein n=1 Tax=Azospirillum brasilense TaxID=192 RepID=UPI003D7C6562
MSGLAQPVARPPPVGRTDSLQDALVRGETVKLPGFGQFEIAERGERTGRNSQTGAEIKIAASKAPAVAVHYHWTPFDRIVRDGHSCDHGRPCSRRPGLPWSAYGRCRRSLRGVFRTPRDDWR